MIPDYLERTAWYESVSALRDAQRALLRLEAHSEWFYKKTNQLDREKLPPMPKAADISHHRELFAKIADKWDAAARRRWGRGLF